MTRTSILNPEFVRTIPDRIATGTLYVSMEFATAEHACCCGCGREVVTPLSPTDWKLTYDGQAVSLHPSIGNWNFDCQSHYWIERNKVRWAPKWSKEQIARGRDSDQRSKQGYYGHPVDRTGNTPAGPPPQKNSGRLALLFRKIWPRAD